MRCPGPPCHLGRHCWRDDAGKRHHRLKTHLESRDDVPKDIRDQVYAKEQQIQGTAVCSVGSRPPSVKIGSSVSPTPLEIAGPRDVAVKKYTAWQCSQVDDRILKMEYQKACAITLAKGLDLELVHEDQDADLYIKNGVKRGVARRFVRDIETWARHHVA
ncbi:hypothetical protein NKR23_g10952 [Pleurostoma richardsiae]|uniref:Uncharacterized protein n=1 Tax=Pleurostoma richardsiae TaxID=41990 RepID=A0AA38R4G0_9PEZI|nr:hypothetical protein NKR23_g10952 [Pleurostoma richardsiae]